jgi:hypothetical protein
MQNLQHSSEQSVAKQPAFGQEVSADQPQRSESDYGKYGSFEGLCEALGELFDEMTPRERVFFIFALECCVTGCAH